ATSSSVEANGGGGSRWAARKPRTSAANACSSSVSARSMATPFPSRASSRSQVPEPLSPVGGETSTKVGFVRVGEHPVGVVPPLSHPQHVVAHPVTTELLAYEGAGDDLVGARGRQVLGDAHVAGPPLGADVGEGVDPGGEVGGIEAGLRPQDQGGHDLVAGALVGDAVDDGLDHVGVGGDGGLDGTGGEVLPVDADPVGVAAREVEE